MYKVDAGTTQPSTWSVVPCGLDRPADGSPGVLGVLRRDLDASGIDMGRAPASCGVEVWATWGVMGLTGHTDRPPPVPPGPWATRIARVISALASLTSSVGARVDVDAAELLTARAAETGWTRRGTASLNDAARLLPAVDGWVAANLARAGDREVLPAVLSRPVRAGAEWDDLARWVAAGSAVHAASALQQVGVPASVVGAQAGTAALRVRRLGLGGTARPAPLVVDLSAMWAGPLTAHLLHRAGARVVTVEDPTRLDGARGGPPHFFESLHRGRSHRAIDLRSASGRNALAELVKSADMVIEASRPRALRQLGLQAEQFVAARPRRTWISITGYGRDAFDGMRVAFGDDAAAAGGLVARSSGGIPVFVADAIADPLTGLWAATAAAASWAAGGGHLLDLSMAGVAAEVAAATEGLSFPHRMRPDGNNGWQVTHEAEGVASC